MLRDVDADVLQSWVDAMSEGAAQAFLLCIEGDKQIGWAGLATGDGERCGLVMCVLGAELADEVIAQLEAVHGAAVTMDSMGDA